MDTQRDEQEDGTSEPDDLCKAVTMLRSEGETARFLHDLCTPGELAALAERWRIARLLDGRGMSYREIARVTAASTTTVARVARFLRDEETQGYRLILDRQKEIQENE